MSDIAAKTIQGFTPAPWAVAAARPEESTTEPAVVAGDYYIATVHDMCNLDGVDETSANATLIAAAPGLLAENERLRAQLKATQDYWLAESKRSATEFQRRIERLRTERDAALDALADLARSCGQPEEAVIPSSNSKRRALAALCAAGRLPEGGGHD